MLIQNIETKEDFKQFFKNPQQFKHPSIKTKIVLKFRKIYNIRDDDNLKFSFKQLKKFDFIKLDSVFFPENITQISDEDFKKELKKLKFSSSKLHESMHLLSGNKYFKIFLKYGRSETALYRNNDLEVEDFYDPLGNCKNCEKRLKRSEMFEMFKTRHVRYRETCSLECENKIHSRNIIGLRNPNSRMSGEVLRKRNEKLSMIMKKKILNGDFTPAVTNSWGKTRCYVNGLPFRSSWEAIFHILHPTYNYENIRIPYELHKTNRIYS